MPRTSQRRSTYNYDVAEIKEMKTRGGTHARADPSNGRTATRSRKDASSGADDGGDGGDGSSSSFIETRHHRRPRTRSSSAESADGSARTERRPAKITARTPRSVRKERRFEDVFSGGESSGHDEGGMTAILQKRPAKQGSERYDRARTEDKGRGAQRGASRAQTSTQSVRRAAENYDEEEDDDGFVYSAAGPSSSRQAHAATESRGNTDKRQRQDAQQKSSYDEADYAFRPTVEASKPAHLRAQDGHRVTSGSIKASRRTSLLKDGAAAYPHPSIPDSELYRHCSSGLSASKRLRHLATWTLERATRNAMEKAADRKGKAKESTDGLRATMQQTLRDLNAGRIELDLPEKSSRAGAASASRLKPHPRNEANKRTAEQLEKTVAMMEKELIAWERARKDMAEYSRETARIDAELTTDGASSELNDDDLLHILGFFHTAQELEQVQEEQVQDAQRALGEEAPWLLDKDDKLTSSIRIAVQASAEALYGTGATQEVAKHLAIARRGSDDDDTSLERGSGSPPPDDLLATPLDPRWRNVEFHSDLLGEKVHMFSQLSRMAEEYTAAVSARGARAIGDLISGGHDKPGTVEDRQPHSSSATASRSDGTFGSDKDVRNLDRILDGLRSLDDAHEGTSTDADAEPDGDLSDGDILRAFVGVNRR